MYDFVQRKTHINWRFCFDPFPRGFVFRDAFSYLWPRGRVFLNPPFELWPRVWEHLKTLLDSGHVTEALCVISQTRYLGHGDKGKRAPCAKEMMQRRREHYRSEHQFITHEGKRHPKGELNIWLVHV